jgi:hypothetical protein
MKSRDSRKKTFRVGSRVKLDFGGREVTGVVIEDRGRLGVGGRRLLRVRLDFSEVAEPIEGEFPESQLRAA